MNLPHLMGIVNVTPDSFSDGGAYLVTEKAISHALRLMDEGANSIDIGGESTRPHASPLSPDEEQARVLPVLAGLAQEAAQRGIKLSIDTRHASTMKTALNEGASIINDVSALTHDPASLQVAVQSNAQIVLMHMQGTPQTMQTKPHYENVVEDVFAYLQKRIAACEAAGIKKEHLIADPGIGFGKTPEHNITLLRNVDRFQALGVPILIGASRKSFIEALTGPCPPDQRLGGSLAAALAAAQRGARYLRVHDVKETRQMLALYGFLT